MPNLGIILIFAAAIAPTPAPTATPADVCGAPRANLLAALNRPSIGYSACALKRGQNVAELGYQNGAGPAGHMAQYPQGLLRFGVAPGLEVDAIGPGYAAARTGGSSTRGFFDSGAGAKYEWWHDGSRALAVDFLYTVPSGAAAFTAGAPVATLNLDYSAPIAGRFSFASTLGAQRGRFFSWLPSAVIADQWNPRAQAFIEAFGQTRVSVQGGSLFGMDAAFQYLLSPNVEADVEIGRTISNGQPQHYVGLGFGIPF